VKAAAARHAIALLASSRRYLRHKLAQVGATLVVAIPTPESGREPRKKFQKFPVIFPVIRELEDRGPSGFAVPAKATTHRIFSGEPMAGRPRLAQRRRPE
jgi:hypothetical protein